MTDHITKAGRAIAEVRERYGITEAILGTFVVFEWASVGPPKQTAIRGTRAECQAWLDEQMATAAFESVLPVGDDLLKAMLNAKPSHVLLDEPGCEEQFTAAIRAICGRRN